MMSRLIRKKKSLAISSYLSEHSIIDSFVARYHIGKFFSPPFFFRIYEFRQLFRQNVDLEACSNHRIENKIKYGNGTQNNVVKYFQNGYLVKIQMSKSDPDKQLLSLSV